MEKEKMIRRVEMLVEAVICVWMFLYVGSFTDAYGWAYPRWATLVAGAALLLHVFCQWKMEKVESDQKIFWIHLLLVYLPIAAMMLFGKNLAHCETWVVNLLVSTYIFVLCVMQGYRWKKNIRSDDKVS